MRDRRRSSRCSTSMASRPTTTPSGIWPATPCSPASVCGCATPSADTGTAYRLGGDEFCVLVTGDRGAATIEAAAQALTERGGAFTIDNSHGSVALGGEVSKPEDALRIVDQRMYESQERRAPVGRRPEQGRARAGAGGAPPRPQLAQRGRVATGRARRAPARTGRGPAGVDPPRGRAARRRQGRHPGRDPLQAGPARRGGVGLHAAPHDHRRAHRRPVRPRSRTSRGWCARATSAGTARATPTSSKGRPRRSARGSSRSATPSTPCARTVPTRRRSASTMRWPSSGAAPARSSIRRARGLPRGHGRRARRRRRLIAPVSRPSAAARTRSA